MISINQYRIYFEIRNNCHTELRSSPCKCYGSKPEQNLKNAIPHTMEQTVFVNGGYGATVPNNDRPIFIWSRLVSKCLYRFSIQFQKLALREVLQPYLCSSCSFKNKTATTFAFGFNNYQINAAKSGDLHHHTI